MSPKFLRCLILMPLAGLLGGCNLVVLHPSGDIAAQQSTLVMVSTALMLLIVVPVLFLILFFAWKYRQSNTEAKYDPDWHHSTGLELIIWSAPLAIIIALGALTWVSTHTLDPYRPLDRIDTGRVIPEDAQPLQVEVVALDWKWLFFYPQYGIATVNELAAPVDVPIDFKITSATVMNSFYVPALAGQIYAMAGMQTQLHAVINKAGVYDGFSANYSGAGFSHMKFKFHGLDEKDFAGWVEKVRTKGTILDRATYMKVEKPSENDPVRYFASYEDKLFHAILNMCVRPGKMCMDEMMHVDAMGGAGKDSAHNVERLTYDAHRLEQGNEGGIVPASNEETEGTPQGMKPDARAPDADQQETAPAEEQGHAMPGMHHDMAAPTH
jgi:cytochrome o ubiquinol oxidase subunit 2